MPLHATSSADLASDSMYHVLEQALLSMFTWLHALMNSLHASVSIRARLALALLDDAQKKICIRHLAF